MCCLITVLLIFGPRLALLAWWFMDTARFVSAFSAENFPISASWPYWVWALIGGIFLPWTTLAYLFVFPGGVNGLDWLILAVALLVDLGSHGGGYRQSRRRRSGAW